VKQRYMELHMNQRWTYTITCARLDSAMGVVLCLFSAACFAALGVFGTLAYDAGVGTTTLLFVRFAMAAAMFAMLRAGLPSVRRAPAMSRRTVLVALGLGAAGYAAQAGLYFGALRHVDVALLSLLLYTYPAFVTVAAIALGRETATRPRIAALLVASAGVALVLAGAAGGRLDAAGAAMGLGAALAYSTYILVADTVVAEVDPVKLSTLVAGGATFTFGVVGTASGALHFGFAAAGWGWLAAMAVVSTVCAVLAFFAGLRRVGPSSASILSCFEPPVTVVLAFLVFGDRLTAVQLAGGALVLSAVVTLQLMQAPAAAPAIA
jgi:drug/metabolite transporter (DMT)-like permease